MGWPDTSLGWVAYTISTISLVVSAYQLLKGLGFGRIGRSIVVADPKAFRRRSSRALRRARDEVFRCGTGIVKRHGSEEFAHELVAVDELFRRRGVPNIRLQTMDHPNRYWAAEVAALKDRDPNFRFFDATEDKPWPFEVCLIDPSKRKSVIIIYFEQDHAELPHDAREFVTSIFIYRDHRLSDIYRRRFEVWLDRHSAKEKHDAQAISDFLNVSPGVTT